MNIKIKKKGLQIFFVEEKEYISKDKLNVTNIWNFKEIIFEKDKLNDDFVKHFLEELFTKENIEVVNIEQISFIPTIFDIIYNIPSIKQIKINEDDTIPSTYLTYFKKLKYIKEIECYQMTSFLFNECNNLKLNISYKKMEFIKSNFMVTNDLNTHSKIYYKKKIVLYNTMSKDDFLDFEYFLSENKSLNKIECFITDEEIYKELIVKLLVNKKQNINIVIYEQNNDHKDITRIIDFIEKKFKKELRLMNIKITISYTKKYKDKYYMKQVNLTFLKILLLILIIITSSIFIISNINKYNSSKKTKYVKNIIEKINEDDDKKEVNDTKQEVINEKDVADTKIIKEKKDAPKIKQYNKNFNELIKINNEFVTWLTVKNTNISYPVVKHKDNSFYLNHSFDKSFNIYGWVFMDFRNNKELKDQNTIIYAHDSYDVMMFGTLKKVLNKSWYNNKDNRIITLENNNSKIEAEIFSIYVIDNTNDYLNIVFSKEEFNNFINKITNRSITNFNNKPNDNDRIITLSTCYKDNKRLVVHAKIKG